MSCNNYIGSYMNRHSHAYIDPLAENGPVKIIKPADPEKVAKLPENRRIRDNQIEDRKEKSLYKKRSKKELLSLKQFIIT